MKLDKETKEKIDNYFNNKTSEELYKLAVKYNIVETEILKPNKKLGVGSKVHFIGNKDIVGEVVDSADVGFNHWLVRWDLVGEPISEWANDLVVINN